MNKEKLRSFIKLTQSEMTSVPSLVDNFEAFMESDFDDAHKYFESIGMIFAVQKQPSDIEICKTMVDIFSNDKDICNMDGDVSKEVLAKTLKHFKGTVDPRRIKEIWEHWLK